MLHYGEVPRAHSFAGLMGQLFLDLILLGLSETLYNTATLMKIDIKRTAFASGQPRGRQQKECLTLR